MQVTCPDFTRLINSDEIKKAVRPARSNKRATKDKKNPLKRSRVMVKLNPYAAVSNLSIILHVDNNSLLQVLKRAAILRQQKLLDTRLSKSGQAAAKKAVKAK